MRQLNLLGKSMKTLSFDSDGIYSIGDCYKTHIRYCVIDDAELTLLKNNISNVTMPDISDEDVVFFGKGADFPKLMLSRLDLKIKRTIKKDNCTKIILNPDNIISKDDVNSLESGYVVMVGGSDETDFNQIFYMSDSDIASSPISLDFMMKFFPGRWIKVTIFSDNVTDDVIQLIGSDPEKITSVQKLAIYLNKNLPTLDSDAARTMVNLFKSGADEKKLAVNMLASFNVSNVLFDICEALGHSTSGSFDQNTRNSVNYKYFKILIGNSPAELVNNWYAGTYGMIRYISHTLFNSGLLSSEQKEKAWKSYVESLIGLSNINNMNTYTKNIFKSDNMPINYDKERETDDSNSEVEGA